MYEGVAVVGQQRGGQQQLEQHHARAVGAERHEDRPPGAEELMPQLAHTVAAGVAHAGDELDGLHHGDHRDQRHALAPRD